MKGVEKGKWLFIGGKCRNKDELICQLSNVRV
jgi:hypothetical protein